MPMRAFLAGSLVLLLTTAAFGQVTPYASVPAGVVRIRLAGASQQAEVGASLVDGKRYTVVALAKGEGTTLKMFQDAEEEGGSARLRVIHAAGELGAPDVRLGKRAIAEKLRFAAATEYASVGPGSYDLRLTKPGGKGAPLVSRRITLSAGSATTAIIAGSGGEETRVIVASDGTATPAAAPETGLGGLAGGGTSWLLVILSAALAGALGGLAHRAATARRSSGR